MSNPSKILRRVIFAFAAAALGAAPNLARARDFAKHFRAAGRMEWAMGFFKLNLTDPFEECRFPEGNGIGFYLYSKLPRC